MSLLMKVLVVCKNPEESEKSDVHKLIEKELNPVYFWKNNLSKKDISDIDIVIAMGGDGTVLSASHYLIDKPLLAVNSDPEKSEGALTTINADQLEDKIKEIKLNKWKEEKLERIEVFINNKPLDLLALNEVFIANTKAYLISKYKLRFKEKEEEQRSSGLIFSTGTGSTAWFKSAHGGPFSPQSKFIKMIVREPYLGRINKFSMLNTIIYENEEIEVVVIVPSVLAIDSIKEYNLNKGDIVKIKISKYPLRRII